MRFSLFPFMENLVSHNGLLLYIDDLLTLILFTDLTYHHFFPYILAKIGTCFCYMMRLFYLSFILPSLQFFRLMKMISRRSKVLLLVLFRCCIMTTPMKCSRYLGAIDYICVFYFLHMWMPLQSLFLEDINRADRAWQNAMNSFCWIWDLILF